MVATNVANVLIEDIPTHVDWLEADANTMWRFIHHDFYIADGAKYAVAEKFRMTIGHHWVNPEELRVMTRNLENRKMVSDGSGKSFVKEMLRQLGLDVIVMDIEALDPRRCGRRWKPYRAWIP